MISLLVGVAACAAGLWGVIHWWRDLMLVMKGFLPISFFFGGLVAIVIGLTQKSPLEKEVGEIAKHDKKS